MLSCVIPHKTGTVSFHSIYCQAHLFFKGLWETPGLPIACEVSCFHALAFLPAFEVGDFLLSFDFLLCLLPFLLTFIIDNLIIVVCGNLCVHILLHLYILQLLNAIWASNLSGDVASAVATLKRNKMNTNILYPTSSWQNFHLAAILNKFTYFKMERKENTVWYHLHVESKVYNKLVNTTKRSRHRYKGRTGDYGDGSDVRVGEQEVQTIGCKIG